MRNWQTMAGIASLIALGLSCGGSSGDSPDEAIDQLMVKLKANMLAGGPTLDDALFAAPPTDKLKVNPLADPPDSSKAFILATAKNDGTPGMSVTVSNTFTLDANKAGTLVTTVSETATGYKFLELTSTGPAPKVAYVVPSWGLKGLKADGTGNAFVIVTMDGTATHSRSFSNVNPANGNRLINFGEYAEPPATVRFTFAASTALFAHVVLAKNNGKLEALLGEATLAAPPSNDPVTASHLIHDGQPGEPMLSIDISGATVGGASLSGPDLMVAVGGDFSGGAGDASPEVTFNVAFPGVAMDRRSSCSVTTTWDTQVTQLGTGGSYDKTVSLAGVNDGKVQLDVAKVYCLSDEYYPLLATSMPRSAFATHGLSRTLYATNARETARFIFIVH
jgi:hypothetical protein